jgi:hypothetical protein
MSKIAVEVEDTELEGDHGLVDGIEVTCSKCGHSVEVYGTSDASIQRGCVMLRDECPEDENNFYYLDEEE